MTKLSTTGTLAYSTYLGGSDNGSGVGTGSDIGKVIAIDGAEIAYIAGDTNSTNFPLAGASVQTTLNGQRQRLCQPRLTLPLRARQAWFTPPTWEARCPKRPGGSR